ncbi:MAG: AAA family ATPase [Magnetococcales bacterium]|nr:AAA family ATPase [Magnetococcales bacterium]
MEPSWTLHIRGLGPIKEADIEVRPFMMFVGPNDVGKSMVASMLYGVLHSIDSFFSWKNFEQSREFIACQNMLQAYLTDNADKETTLNHDDNSLITALINRCLEEKKDAIVQSLFSTKRINILELSITYSYTLPISLKKGLSDSNIFLEEPLSFSIPANIYNENENTNSLAVFFRFLFRDLLTNHVGDIFGAYFKYPLYFPTSRSGYTLTYRTIASEMMNQFGVDPKPQTTKLAQTTINFLQRLIHLEITEHSEYSDTAEQMEQNIINGKILLLDTGGMPEIRYQPKGSDQHFPLHNASSLVSELASLVLFLRYKTEFSFLFIDEPEAHLHITNQRKLAGIFANLVNQGIPVCIATHSDILFQQVNNLIKMSRFPRLTEEYGYQPEDVFDPNQVAAYSFEPSENGTVVQKIECTKHGFAAVTFNDELMALSKETLALQENDQ